MAKDTSTLAESWNDRLTSGNKTEIGNKSQQGNKWTEYTGIVLENKPKDSREIKVELKELLPFMEGDVKVIEQEKQVSNSSPDNSTYSKSIKTTNVVTATYYGMSSNRTFPPDVVKGEQVIVRNYADSDKYYWESSGRDDKLRKRERHRIAVANKPDSTEELSDENTYSLTLNSIDKEDAVILKTTKSDGEQYQYLIKINTKDGTMTLCDDVDNAIIVESEAARITMRNTNGTSIVLEKDNATIIAPDTITTRGGKMLNNSSPLEANMAPDGNKVQTNTYAGSAFNNTDTFKVTSKCIGLEGAVVAKTIVADKIMCGGVSYGTPVQMAAKVSKSFRALKSGMADQLTLPGIPDIPKKQGTYYTDPFIDIDSRFGYSGNNSPIGPSGDDNQRHASAWEELVPCIDNICDMLQCLINYIGSCQDTTDVSRELVRASIMEHLRDE